jgi:hypothetical protein
MPLACLCIFVDGLVELQLDGVGSALFKSIKFQFFASEDDFITLQASLPVHLLVRRLSFETGYVNLPTRASVREIRRGFIRLLKPTTTEISAPLSGRDRDDRLG